MPKDSEGSHKHGRTHLSRRLSALLIIAPAVFMLVLAVQQHRSSVQASHAGISPSTNVIYAADVNQNPVTNESTIGRRSPKYIGSSNDIRDQLALLADKIERLESRGKGTSTVGQMGDFTAELYKLRRQLAIANEQVNQIVNEQQWVERTVAALSDGVCLIEGEYIFVDPETGQPLRYIRVQTEQDVFADGVSGPLVSAKHNDTDAEALLPLSTAGKGQLLAVRYTGTGFLIRKSGYIVTNRHVAKPWTIATEYESIIAAGYKAKHCRFRAFFPKQQIPFSLKIIADSQADDIALLHADLGQANIPILPCHVTNDNTQNDIENSSALRVGQTVIVLGYPTGFDMLLAKMSQDDLEQIVGTEGVSFDEMVENMAKRGLIEPVATRGMCGRVGSGKIIYDAPTTIGGSGAPVLGPSGEVVGINTALLKGFSGTNFGVPIDRALRLLKY